MNLMDVANKLRNKGIEACDGNRPRDAIPLWETAFTAALMCRSQTPISFKFLPKESMPHQVSAVEHVVVHISGRGIIFYALLEFAVHPTSELKRYPMVGEFFSKIAQILDDDGIFECIVDLGDGNDAGEYRRIAYCSARADTVLVPDPYLDMSNNYELIRYMAKEKVKPWQQRNRILFWRGTAGGAVRDCPSKDADLDRDRLSDWDWAQRVKLCAASRNSVYANMIDVGLSTPRQLPEHLQRAVQLAGFVRPAVNKEKFSEYKYLIDIDGWTNSWSLFDKLIVGATIFKVQSAFGYRQWYYDRLIPWEHFIPVNADISDLDEKITWALAHDQQCEKIAINSATLASEIQLQPELAKAQADVIKILTRINVIMH